MAQEQAHTNDTCERIPYREMTDPEFARQAADTFTASREADGSISLVGTCPRCSVSMEVLIPEEMFLANRTGLLGRMLGRAVETTSQADGSAQEVPIICLCTKSHPGRPENRKGCGAYWNLAVGGKP
jgi:hypothetical protein